MSVNYIAWDTETTGKYEDGTPAADAPYIVQIAAIKYRNDVEVGSFVTLIRPPNGIRCSDGATAVHGISQEQLESDGLSFEEAWTQFDAFTKDDTVMVAHNNRFDESVLRVNLARFGIGLKFFETKTMACTLKLRRQKQFRDGKLSEIYQEFFNEPLQDAHDALNDSRAVGLIYPILRDYRYIHSDIGVREVCINASDVDVACANFYGRSMADKLVNSLWRKYKPETFTADRDDDILIKYAWVVDEVNGDTSLKPSQSIKKPKYSHLSAYEKYIVSSHVTLERWKAIRKTKFPGVVENSRFFRTLVCTIEGTRYYIVGKPYALVHEAGVVKIIWPKYRTGAFEGLRDSEELTAQVYMHIVRNCDEVHVVEIFRGEHRLLPVVKKDLEKWSDIKAGVKHFASYFHSKLSLHGRDIRSN